MPKKFSIADKRNWLAKYEGGKSEVAIASESKCDIRTLRKGMNEARLERDAQLAKSELITRALLNHQDVLKNELNRIISEHPVPNVDQAVLSWEKGEHSIFNKNGQESKESSVRLGRDAGKYFNQPDLAEEMLREHLVGDNLWKLLARREKAYSGSQGDRIALQRKVVSVLEEETGYRMIDTMISEPYLCSYTLGNLFYQRILGWAFGNHDIRWKDDIVVDKDSGKVKYGGSILAESHGTEEDLRKKLITAFDKMKTLSELRRVVESHRELEEETRRLQRAADEILALGLISGRCRVCQRLGI